MKKILIVFLGSLFFLVNQKVYAQTYNGKLYEVWHPNSGFTVFAQESNGWMDYNSWMIKSTIDDGIYYCIDPAIPLEGSFVGSHNYITGKENILDNANITSSQYDKVQLIAYYGYGYKDDKVDHTSKKWYGITQVMIWRVMRPDLKWTFKADRNSTPDSKLYLTEVNEINNLVDNHYKYPSFKQSTAKIYPGKVTELVDSNNLLQNFKVYTFPSSIDVKISGNKLLLSSNVPQKSIINFEKKLVTRTKFALLASNDYQDLILMGMPGGAYFMINTEVSGGTINIHKNDFDNKSNVPNGLAKLNNAIYEVLDCNDNVVGEIKTDNLGNGSISLNYGKYKVREKSAPVGYLLDDNIYDVEINVDNSVIDLNVFDKVIKGKVKFLKLKGGADEEFSPEAEAIVDVLDMDGNVVHSFSTSVDGTSSFDLPYGKYVFRQKSGADGYVLSDDIELVIDDDKDYSVEMRNIKLSMLNLFKYDDLTKKGIENVSFDIFNENDELIFSGKTDGDGRLIVSNLEIGKYYIIEKQAPSMYEISNERIYFDVPSNGKVISVDAVNSRKKGNLKIIKKDSISDFRLSNAKIKIVFNDDNNVNFLKETDKNGEIIINNLTAGSYCAYEIDAPLGYQLYNSPICFDVLGDGDTLVVMKNDKKIEVPDTYTFDYIGFVLFFIIVVGIIYILYGKKNFN